MLTKRTNLSETIRTRTLHCDQPSHTLTTLFRLTFIGAEKPTSPEQVESSEIPGDHDGKHFITVRDGEADDRWKNPDSRHNSPTLLTFKFSNRNHCDTLETRRT
ncbi:hypothetical protein HanXRQr2_Chr12g0558631 [Helianthus annuus]|uniref:Uncharacterized protein n=1 Tax=Helianthus annuus TaxID=4232 RepID=A0A9K3HJC0_HELAN|nr:hypothetical protein HanXRQr2_Chr12g0558631 [Helianthus annuus]KAJ0864100.1 hypothetical protein HanPSC8_Chr12g0537801 [Helianthus annuus]